MKVITLNLGGTPPVVTSPWCIQCGEPVLASGDSNRCYVCEQEAEGGEAYVCGGATCSPSPEWDGIEDDE